MDDIHDRGGRFAGHSPGRAPALLATLALAALLVAASGVMAPLDRAVDAGLNAMVSPHPAVIAMLETITVLGNSVTGWVVLGTLTLYLLARRQRRLAAFVAVTGLGGAILGPSIKLLVGRTRPVVNTPIATAPGPSFPSGHALTTTVMIGVLLLVLLPTAPTRAHRPLIAVGSVLVALVAFTRLALGVHFLSDVLGGLTLGIAWLTITTTAFHTWRRHHGLPVPPPDDGLEPEAAPALEPAPDPEPAPVHRRAVAARLLVAAVLALGIAVGTGLLITHVAAGSRLEHADTAIDQWLAEHRNPTLNTLSGLAAELGNTRIVIGVGLVVAVLSVAALRRWRPALVLAVALLGELAIFLTTTAVVDRPRPTVVHLDAALPPTSSFPSGHTAASICLYGGIAAIVLASTRAWWRWLVLALAVTVVLVVAAARLYRGAHYPTDILGSILFAVPWLLTTLTLLPLQPRPGPPPAHTSTDREPAGLT